MSKLVSISIDVTKIPRDKIIPHKSGGKYVSMDIWINDEPDQYGKDCSVNISQSKEERERKDRKVYCGNGNKRFGFDETRPAQAGPAATATADDDGCDDIPF